MSKHVGEKCGKLCISSIVSYKRGITHTKLDGNWRHSNLICSTVKQSHNQNFSSICQSMLEKSVENWRTGTRTDGESDGRRPGRTDGHHHTIIHPVWRKIIMFLLKTLYIYKKHKPLISCYISRPWSFHSSLMVYIFERGTMFVYKLWFTKFSYLIFLFLSTVWIAIRWCFPHQHFSTKHFSTIAVPTHTSIAFP